MNYTLYIGNKNYSSWSLRPWVLLTQLEIGFNEKLVPFDDGKLGSSYARFREFSPTGLVPCLHHDNLRIWESLGIVEYLAEQHSQVWPSEVHLRAWARSAAAEMHAGFSALRNECPMTVGLRVKLHEQSTALEADLVRLTELWQQGLDNFGGPFLAGSNFTAVDAFFAPVVYRLQTYNLADNPTLTDYCATMLDLPSMRSWTADAHAETFREPGHEEEIRELGEWLEDFRS